MLPIAVTIYLTNKCSLSCKHCFIDKSKIIELDYKRLLEVLDDLKKNNVCIIAYTGGDANKYSKFFEILEITYNKGMLPMVGMSAFDINDKFIKKLSKMNIGCVQVSLDGSNDKINGILRGENKFDEIINNIKKMINENIKVNLATCFHKYNFNDYKNIIDLFYELNAFKVKIQFLNYESKNNLISLTLDQKLEIIDYCRYFEEKKGLNDWININQYDLKNRTDLINIHKKSLIIFNNGDIKNYDNGEVIGNIYEKLPSEIFKEKL